MTGSVDPLSDNPLRTRADAQRAVRDIVEPLFAHFSPGNARVCLGHTGASFPTVSAEIEGFSRPLWALAPLAAGGGVFDDWHRYRDGLRNGADPDHPEFWGDVHDHSQKVVEMAAIGVTLALAPDQLWKPLGVDAQQNVAEWLHQVNEIEIPDSNWRFFRVLTNLGLREVGAVHDWERAQVDLDRLESFSLTDGWYADGPNGPCDYYSAWEMHVDGLVCAVAASDADRADRFRKRAAAFAKEFRYWFTPGGAALPYGRSLIYRFAQGAFWGALALADVEALPWGVIKGLWFRHLRWWADRPIFTNGGVLSLGYAYPTLKMTEPYNSPSSPYWGMKFFLPLALPSNHPFWTTEERSLPELDTERELPSANMVVSRDPENDHVAALHAGYDVHSAEKYNKFAYSTQFGFCVASGPHGLTTRGIDSTLALTSDGEHFRVRSDVVESRITDGAAYSRWIPWPDVSVNTWLVPATPWHVRVHLLETDRRLSSVEGGFALDRDGDDDHTNVTEETTEGTAVVSYPVGLSGIRDTGDENGDTTRPGGVVYPDPNTNLLHPRTAVPVLHDDHDPGKHWLTCTVLGIPGADRGRWDGANPPTVSIEKDTFRVTATGGEILFETDSSES